MLPPYMLAVEVIAPGPESRLQPSQLPLPSPGPDEALIRVAYAGVNRADLMQREGSYPPPPGASPLLGLEVSGEIAAIGKNVTGWKVGDPVCALLSGGGYAEYCTAPAAQLLPVPRNLDMRDAAALPEALFTVWGTLFEEAKLQPGETLLVHGGASGIGTTAIQVGKIKGVRVIVTAGTQEKCLACLKLGAEKAICYPEEDFVAAVKTHTNGRGADAILDMAGGDYIQRNFSALAVGGRMVSIAFLRGAKQEINMAPLLLKRLTWIGSTLRGRSTAEKARMADALRREIWPKVVKNELLPVIDSEFSLKEAEKAHTHMQQSLNIGKIVLKL